MGVGGRMQYSSFVNGTSRSSFVSDDGHSGGAKGTPLSVTVAMNRFHASAGGIARSRARLNAVKPIHAPTSRRSSLWIHVSRRTPRLVGDRW